MVPFCPDWYEAFWPKFGEICPDRDQGSPGNVMGPWIDLSTKSPELTTEKPNFLNIPAHPASVGHSLINYRSNRLYVKINNLYWFFVTFFTFHEAGLLHIPQTVSKYLQGGIVVACSSTVAHTLVTIRDLAQNPSEFKVSL